MSSASTKLDGVQTLRGVAAVVVALFHFSVLERAFYGPDFLLTGFSGYGRAGVDLFFVISGFIMVLVPGQTRSGAQSAWEFLVKRAVRIYPPYWVVTLAVIAIWWLSGGFLMAFLIGKNPNWIASLTLWPQDRYPILLVGWTLIHEMYFYLVFAALLFAPIAWRPRLLALWALIVLASTLFGVKPTSAVEKVVLSFESLDAGVYFGLRSRAGSASCKGSVLAGDSICRNLGGRGCDAAGLCADTQTVRRSLATSADLWPCECVACLCGHRP
jgi:peptidoglycan/LPS O-acetylase OafA/YrhL